MLAPLGNYGGPTQTMPLLFGSPAIDAGSNDLVPPGITTDQRGEHRIFNGKVDIGAYELQVVIVPSGATETTPALASTFWMRSFTQSYLPEGGRVGYEGGGKFHEQGSTRRDDGITYC